MTKQEEIREGIANILLNWLDCEGESARDNYDIADELLKSLSVKGVVILKEDSPKSCFWWLNWDKAISEAVEPLIGDKDA